MKVDREKLIDLLNGGLPDHEEMEVRQSLASSATLRNTLAELESLKRSLTTVATQGAEDNVRPFLAQRVLGRIAGRRATTWIDETADRLATWFRPVAVACALVIAGLAVHNAVVSSQYNTETSLTEQLLGLPPVSIATAYDMSY